MSIGLIIQAMWRFPEVALAFGYRHRRMQEILREVNSTG